MKRCASMILAVLLLLTCVFAGSQRVHASGKTEQSRAIGIVFDNSGSMYIGNNQAWCRATYAMEVFISMLNKGDTLRVYPMNPFSIGSKEYTMDKPLEITDSAQASQVREIVTPGVGDTHIESIDRAISGLEKMQADEKYLIVLSDGDDFYENGRSMGKSASIKGLNTRFQKASENIKMMYLGIGRQALMPDTANSEVFTKKQAADSDTVLSSLTEMCNLIFGRDSMPKNHLTESTMDFDISMKKLIVFVQGENIENLKVTDDSGNEVGTQVSSQQTKYSTTGSSHYTAKPDTSLQGMIVTYADCAAGKYNIEYSGTATSTEVYYEPDADLEFVFTDANGNDVDPKALYEGEYKVSFGMKDGKTGKLIASDLLGDPEYTGSYFINGQEFPITHKGYSGEEPVSLKMNDSFDANLTVKYLSGYTIRKDSSDFGWPEGGIKVAARPAGDLELLISGGQALYSLQHLEEGLPYIAEVKYQGKKLTGKELEKVELKWDPDTSNAEIKQEFAEDHYNLSMHYKDPNAPEQTKTGECTVTIYAFYAAQGSSQAQAQVLLTYNIEDDFSPLQMQLRATQDYIVISELGDSAPITAELTFNGAPLTEQQLGAVQMQVETGGIEYEVTPNPQNSSFTIQLLDTPGIGQGDYRINVKAIYTDNIGRPSEANGRVDVTLSDIPLWIKWVAALLILLLLIILIIIILRIKVLPTHMHTTQKESSMNYDGEIVTKHTNFVAELKKKSAKVQTKYGGRKFGISMDVTPGKESFLYKPHKRRSAIVKVTSVKKFGPAKIQEAMIGSAKYVLDDTTGKLVPAIANQKPFPLTNGMTVKYSGIIQDAGVDKDFESISKLNFKKK